ncbi:MAG TPA: type III-B CRISPR module-associated protein Cmr5 [Candidatus Nocardiopsis merdipullorum]|nr:type III-B CRISPR module-associated protein Cmr5 [Candidatus Nocardiopsis merdipullorum]
MRRIDQDMATTAAGLLPEATGDNAKELRSRFRHLPVQLHGSGLAATYAFIAARSNSASSERLTQAYRDVARQIRAHLADKGLLHESLVSAEEPGVHRETLSALGDMDWATYARAGREVAVLFSWLRKLADAVYPSTKPTANRSAGEGDR